MFLGRTNALALLFSGENDPNIEGFSRKCCLSAATLLVCVLGGVIVSLFVGGLPAFAKFGFGFFTSTTWNPVTEVYGAEGPIAGTVITAAASLIIALPIAIGVAVFPTEFCPRVIAGPLGCAVELPATAEVLPAVEKSHEVSRCHRFDFAPQPPECEPVNTGEQPAVAPFDLGSRERGSRREAAAQNLPLCLESGERGFHEVRREQQVARQVSGGPRSRRFEPPAHRFRGGRLLVACRRTIEIIDCGLHHRVRIQDLGRPETLRRDPEGLSSPTSTAAVRVPQL